VSGSRVDIDQAAVLDAVVKQLIDNMVLPSGDGLTDKTCFITIYPELPTGAQDEVIVTVSPEGGTFPAGMIIGGGQKQCTEESGILVSMWSRFKVDRQFRDRESLCNETRGLLKLKKSLLKALCAVDLQANYPPGTGGTNSFLRQYLIPTQAYAPDHPKEEPYAGLTIRFQADYDWDLTS